MTIKASFGLFGAKLHQRNILAPKWQQSVKFFAIILQILKKLNEIVRLWMKIEL